MSGPEFKDHFSARASQYATFRPRYPAALFDWLVQLTPDTVCVWEAGAGNGQATVDLADRFNQVIATDASEKQISLAVRDSRVDYRVGHAEESGLLPGSCDLVVAAQALHWFIIPAFFAEARRVLSPGGLIAVWCYTDPVVRDRKVNPVFQEFAKRVAPYWPPERAIVDTGYRSVAFPFEELEAPEFAMEHAMTRAQFIGYVGTWSATNRYIEELLEDPVRDLERQIADLWPDDETRVLTWSLHVRAGRKGHGEVLR